METIRKGMLLVISGPSGAGKGTLCSRLLQGDPSFHFSVSVTTRAPRYNETPGVSYYFISDEEYDKLLEQDAFIECATVHGHRYGTLKSEVYQQIESGQNVILDIDSQGAQKVMEREQDCVSVFILPPSYKELRVRLHTRNTDDPKEIERRLNNARGEIEKAHRYRYVIVNDTVELAYSQLCAIVTAEKHNTKRFFPVVTEE